MPRPEFIQAAKVKTSTSPLITSLDYRSVERLQEDLSVKILDLRLQPLDGVNVGTITACLMAGCKSLKELILTGCTIDEQKFETLKLGLEVNESVESLKLGLNLFGPSSIPVIAAALRPTRVRVLGLADTYLHVEGAQALAEAFSGAAAPPSIMSLDVSGCSFGDEGMQIIARVIPQMSLTSLDIGRNVLAHVGACTISDALWKNKKLRSLGLCDTNLGDDKVAAIAVGGLQFNRTLTHLTLSANPIGSKGMEQLDYMLRRNPVLLRIDIENAPVAQEVAANVNSKLQRNADLHKTWWLLSLIAEKGSMPFDSNLRLAIMRYFVPKQLPGPSDWRPLREGRPSPASTPEYVQKRFVSGVEVRVLKEEKPRLSILSIKTTSKDMPEDKAENAVEEVPEDKKESASEELPEGKKRKCL